MAGITSGAYIGQTGRAMRVVEFSVTLDNAACAIGDLVADALQVTGLTSSPYSTMRIVRAQVFEVSASAIEADLDFWFSNAEFLTASNAALDLSADPTSVLGKFSVVAADYVALAGGGCSMADKEDVNLDLVPVLNDTRFWLQIVNADSGAITFDSAATLFIRLWVSLD